MTAVDTLTNTGKGAHFTISYPPSLASSRSASPTPSLDHDSFATSNNEQRSSVRGEKAGVEVLIPGRRPMDVYDATLPPWRAALRRSLVKSVHWESEIIAKMQVRRVVQYTSHEMQD